MKWDKILTKQLLETELLEKEKFICHIARDLGCSSQTVYKYLKKYNIDVKRKGRIKDLTNRIFDYLTVLERSENDRFMKTKWKCRCKCGNITYVNGGSLLRRLTKSCGCYKHEINFDGLGEICGVYWKKIQKGALRRGIEFSVKIKDAWELFLKQNRKCAITNVDIYLTTNWDKAAKCTASLDRKDSFLPYTLDNIQWVHKRINRMKGNINSDELLFWAKKIYLNNKNLADNTVFDTNKLGWNGYENKENRSYE